MIYDNKVYKQPLLFTNSKSKMNARNATQREADSTDSNF